MHETFKLDPRIEQAAQLLSDVCNDHEKTCPAQDSICGFSSSLCAWVLHRVGCQSDAQLNGMLHLLLIYREHCAGCTPRN